MSRLAMFSPAPVIETGDTIRLDAKFVEGMALHCAEWPGPVRCYLWRGNHSIPFGTEVKAGELGFELVLLDADEAPTAQHLDGVDVILASADDERTLSLADIARQSGAKIVYSIEYTLGTRLTILRIDRPGAPLRQLRGALWTLQQERRRRRAFRAADGLQINGYPAEDAYAGMNPNSLTYLDGRVTHDLMASESDMETRRQRLRSGAPLRLIHSGRLEPMKGAGDLMRVMHALRKSGVEATLDIYGTGSVRQAIQDELAGFDGSVHLHDPVDFNMLAKMNRQKADIFLSCHLQSDPSCSYLEAMGGGLSVVGYDNRMWRRLAAESGGGPVAPLGDPAALAEAIARFDQNRELLIECCDRALAFARKHDFSIEFKRRMAHLRDLVRPGA